MIAERAGESFVRTVVRIQRKAENIGSACRERLRRLAEPSGTHIAHHRKPGGGGKRPHQMEARDAGNAGDVIERQRRGEMAFDVPERFLGRIMTDSFPAKRPHYAPMLRASFDSPCSPFPPLTMYRSAMGGNHADHQCPGASYPHP